MSGDEPVEHVDMNFTLDVRDMTSLCASEVACYRWPDDTTEHKALRTAFCDGAAHSASMPPEIECSDIDGLYGRLPGKFAKLVRKIADAPNYDFGAMELLDAFGIEWRKS